MTFSDTAPGKLVNLLSNDVNRFEVLSVFNRLLIVDCLQNKHNIIGFFSIS